MTAPAKVLDLEALAARAAELKKAGKKVVQSHGVFDLLHVGHIKHLKEAKGFGDVLMVTLTPDRFVNKGPHRPAFPEHLRAEALAALADVDYVAVNRWPTAVEALKMIRPGVYAKGPDYRNPADDITGKIKDEEAAVKAGGGEIRFTEDVTFSSSALINRHMDLLPDGVKAFLEEFRGRRKLADVAAAIESLKTMRVSVVGEVILDEYVYCDALGKSSKEPTLAVLRKSREMYAGGVLAIANHLAEFCREVEVVTFLGDRDARADFVREHLRPNVKLSAVTKSNSPTIVKRRYVEGYSLAKMFEVYEMNDELLAGADEEALCGALEAAMDRTDAVIVADYGHGFMTTKAIEVVCRKAPFLAVNTQINAANIGFHAVSRYPRADYVCIQESEIRLENRSRQGDLKIMVTKLWKTMGCKLVTVTRGRTGTLMCDAKGEFTECPAFAVKVVDRIGAGDAVLALTSVLAAKGTATDVLGLVGNLAGAQAVVVVGNKESLNRVRLLKTIESLIK